MIKSKKAQKSVFWESLILAIFIFVSGILLGYFLEQNRTSKIIGLYQESELNMLDIKIQDSIFSLSDVNCDNFLKETIVFADKIYGEAQLLDRYEESSKITQGIILQHKKYDLLRTLLWIETIKFKEKCNNDFETIVYFYEYKSDSMDIKSKQDIFSKKLEEVKNKHGNEVILIPIAGNLDISSVSYLMEQNNISTLPAILINEKVKISSIEELSLIDSYLN